MKKTRFPLESRGYTFRGRLAGLVGYDGRGARRIIVYTRQNASSKDLTNQQVTNPVKSISYVQPPKRMLPLGSIRV
jgi:hypothetical protein